MDNESQHDRKKRRPLVIAFLFALVGLLSLNVAASLFQSRNGLGLTCLVIGLAFLALTIWWAKPRG